MRAQSGRSSTSLDLLAVGDVMVDITVNGADLSQTQHVQRPIRLHPGGSAANAAVWAAAAGATVGIVGKVGNDAAAAMVTHALEERGVHVSLKRDVTTPTGAVLTLGETVIASRGATGNLSPLDLPEAIEAAAILVSGYILLPPSSEAAARASLDHAAAQWLAVDPASAALLKTYGAERFFSSTEAASVVLANEEEAFALTGEQPEQAARLLANRYRIACVKRGPAGAIGAEGGALHSAGAPVTTAVDRTGAGDAFAAGFLMGLVRGGSVSSALRNGCRFGALCAASRDPWPPAGLQLELSESSGDDLAC
jgi:sugar/nucleoside kinase (ribokinase family)